MDKLKDPREDKEQIALVNKLERMGHLVHHSPNGMNSNPITGAMFKKMGTKAGWPDMEIMTKKGGVIFVELKRRKGGVLSKAQIDIHEKLRVLGHTVIVGYGAKDAYEKLIKIGI